MFFETAGHRLTNHFTCSIVINGVLSVSILAAGHWRQERYDGCQQGTAQNGRQRYVSLR